MTNIFTYRLPILISLFAFLTRQTLELSVEKFLSLSQNERLQLDKFKDAIAPFLPYEYMQQDIFLIRFLRDQDFNVERASQKLLKHIEWRRIKGIDNILTEDLSEIEKQLKINVEGCNKEQQPVISAFIGDYNFRRLILAGQTQKVLRFFEQIFENLEVILRKMRQNGETATQATFIFDFNNFDMQATACPRCLPLLMYMFLIDSQNYPGLAHRLIAVNAPQIALPVWNILRQVATPQTRELISVFGKNKKEWMAELFKEIDKSQLSHAFGGEKEESVEYTDLKRLFTHDSNYTCDTINHIIM